MGQAPHAVRAAGIKCFKEGQVIFVYDMSRRIGFTIYQAITGKSAGRPRMNAVD